MFKRLKNLFGSHDEPDHKTTDQKEKQYNQRDNFRVYLDHSPLCGEMKISRIKGKVLDDSKSINIYILDISAGGLKFQSGLNLPLENNYVMNFSVHILGVRRYFEGEIVRKQEIGNYFQYGVKFRTYGDQSATVQYLQKLDLLLKKKETLPKGCSFCKSKKNYCNQCPLSHI